MNKINEIKKEFYLKGKSNYFYKENKFNEALYRLTNIIDKFFLNSMLSLNIDIQEFQTNLRFSYMSIIKKIYNFIPKTDDEISKTLLMRNFDDISDELSDVLSFNTIRNMFDRLEIGTLNAKLKEGIVHFQYNNIKKINTDLYSRWVDKEKPFLQSIISETDSTKKSFNDFFDSDHNNLWDNDKNKPKNMHRMKLIYNNCYRRIIDELLDVEENIEFTEFSLDDFRKVYASIQSFGVVKSNNCILNFMRKKSDQMNPIVEMEYDVFIEYISDMSNIETQIVKKIIDILIYDYDFHKSKITIYQPIFKARNKIFFSTMLVYYSMPQDKLLYFFNKKRQNAKAITKIAHQREEIMTKNMRKFLADNNRLLVSEGYVLYENNKTIAEFDLVAVDIKAKKILVLELKWFLKRDGDLDLINIDKKLIQSIEIRNKRLKLFKQYKNKIILDLFNFEIDDTFEVLGAIITENSIGSINVNNKLPIFDRFAFYFTIDSVNYNLGDFSQIIKNDDFLPIPPYKIEYQTLEYYNQKYVCPLLRYDF